ncbi:MAG: hypothetical protein CMG74_12710 [Candidatus Marinimicrobia bacterium]|nr:hypothetical protein [Candidatus Neomarinimicrobiota bacterium]
MENKRKKIFLTISHGWQARLLLQTEFLNSLLNNNLEIIIFTPCGKEKGFLKEFSDKATIIETVQQGGILWSRFNNIRRYLVSGKMSKTKEILLEKYTQNQPMYSFITSVINSFFKYIPITKKIFSFFDRLIFRDSFYKHYFDKYKPDAVIIVSTVHNEAHYMLQRSYIEGVKCIHIVESWDNPSAKLNQIKHPDYFLVWNESMAEELNEFLGIKKNRIHITGSAFHDIASDKKTFASKQDIARRYGMDPDKKWILIASTLSNLYPDFDYFLGNLNSMKLNNSLHEEFQILIRPHPQAISGYSIGHGIEDLKKIQKQYSYIFFDIPRVIKSKLPVYLESSDIKNYSEILNIADVVISFFSTATIDASILNTPVILPAFGNYQEMASYPTMKERVQFTHHSKLIATNGVSLSYNYGELADELNKYLSLKDDRVNERKRLVEYQCGAIDGLSYKRMSEAIINIVNNDSEYTDTKGYIYYY